MTVENQLVADMVAERIIDVLEVIKVDDRTPPPSQAAFTRTSPIRLLQPFAEINTIGQAAHRIVQGEMTQFPLAVSASAAMACGGTTRMAHDQGAEKQRKAERSQLR